MQLSKLDINIMDYDFKDNTTLIPTFKDVLTNNYESLQKYVEESKYVYKNVTLQTSLMLACYIGDLKAVETLISKEIGYVDLYDHSALYYALHSCKNENQSKIIEMINEYEFVIH
jgi:hypothetical protein